MIIKFWIGVLIAIALFLAITILFTKLFKRLGKNAGVGSLIGFFTGIGLMLYMLIGLPRLYVVTDRETYEHYMVIGSTTFDLADGKKADVNISFGSCMVINNTERSVYLEEVVYGFVVFPPPPDEIPPMSVDLFETRTIDYFFDDAPPDEISVSEGSDSVSKFWLR